MKNDVLTNRMNLANHKFNVPHSKLLTGSTADKYPVILDGGKTIIFIADLLNLCTWPDLFSFVELKQIYAIFW